MQRKATQVALALVGAALLLSQTAWAQEGKAIMEMTADVQGAKGVTMSIRAGKCSLLPMDKVNSKRSRVSRQYIFNATVYGESDKIKKLLEAWKKSKKPTTVRLSVLPKLSGSPYLETKKATLKSSRTKGDGAAIVVTFPQDGISGDAPRVVGACLTINR